MTNNFKEVNIFMRKESYVVERAVHGDNFKNEVMRLITGQYGVTEENAKVAFENCMEFGFAVILPVSKKYPVGVMMATDIYRQKIAIG